MTLHRFRFIALLVVSCAASSLITARFMKIQQARADSNRVYELRVDRTLPGRLGALSDRVGRLQKLFVRYNMTPVGFWIPQDSPGKENMFIYMLSHESREAARKNPAAFGADPEWKELQKTTEADGKIIEKFEQTFLNPVSYSPLK